MQSFKEIIPAVRQGGTYYRAMSNNNFVNIERKKNKKDNWKIYCVMPMVIFRLLESEDVMEFSYIPDRALGTGCKVFQEIDKPLPFYMANHPLEGQYCQIISTGGQ